MCPFICHHVHIIYPGLVKILDWFLATPKELPGAGIIFSLEFSCRSCLTLSISIQFQQREIVVGHSLLSLFSLCPLFLFWIIICCLLLLLFQKSCPVLYSMMKHAGWPCQYVVAVLPTGNNCIYSSGISCYQTIQVHRSPYHPDLVPLHHGWVFQQEPTHGR